MNLLSIENLSKSYGEKILFKNISFGLSKGDKFGLIANNGVGKSTLLKILCGSDYSDSGSFTYRNGCRISYLEQNPNFDKYSSIRELISDKNHHIIQLKLSYQKAISLNKNDNSNKSLQNIDDLTLEMDRLYAWDYEDRYIAMLERFNFKDLEKDITKLSGGQKKRLSLVSILMEDSDIIFLDEPTNHLDVSMIEWLEKFLQKQDITLLMITHDRYFLERVTNHIIELDANNIYHHNGNYKYFLEKRLERKNNLHTEVDKAKKLMKKELEWLRRSPKARTTKSKSRIDSFYKIQSKAKIKTTSKELNIDIKMNRIGGKVLELINISKTYDNVKIIDKFNYVFKKGERIGVIGGNGVGKSTFLNILTQSESIDNGKVIIGETIKYGYFTQNGIKFDENIRVIECLKNIADYIVMSDSKKISASQLLEHFMFDRNLQNTRVKSLSGGEKRRLYLLTILMKNPNFLILDEPTNDLDLITLSKLEDFLIDYQGCIIIVSHDRYFMDKLVDHLFVFEGNGVINNIYSSYSDYRKNLDNKKSEFKKVQHSEKTTSKIEKKNEKISYKIKFELEKLETEINKLEKQKKILESDICDTNIDHNELINKSNELGIIIKQLNDKEDRWILLND
ncbi:MAG: ABC-F family ATP-binding cassette domain-containing protein [Flavobacteriales bacterium]|jgi:ATP-binding cassette subfamily F protein uup|tara:strand:- start:84343 stop:86211 length:1869 start_codon:yes stop_codon:yes gene_type:complete